MTFEEIDNILRVHFRGNLTTTTCEEIAETLARQVQTSLENHPDLVLEFDLKETPLITSAFLSLCIIYYKKLGAKHFRVVNCNENIRNVFATSGLLDIMSYTDRGRNLDLSG